MCFSTAASFGAGVVLAGVGVMSLKKAVSPSWKAFALIPILFSIQQFSEGLVWWSLDHPNSFMLISQKTATYNYLAFAWMIWPILIPYALRRMEPDERKKRIISLLLCIGVGLALMLGYSLFTFDIEASISYYHIAYHIDLDYSNGLLVGFFYLLATVMPLLISSVRKAWILGVINMASYAFTKIFFADTFVSVWCFFAAASSVMVLYLIYQTSSSAEQLPAEVGHV